MDALGRPGPNGRPDLLDEARWGLEWLLSVQDAAGGFRNSTCQTGYGPYGTNAPQTVPPYVNGEVGTLPTARAAQVRPLGGLSPVHSGGYGLVRRA